MKFLNVSDDDETLFGSELGPDQFMFFTQHKNEFARMWKNQGTGFWIRFVVSLRSFLKRQNKFMVKLANNADIRKQIVRSCEVVYCKITEAITRNSHSAIQTLVENVATVAENKYTMILMAQKLSAEDLLYNKISRSAFKELFGDPTRKETFITMCDRMRVFLHAAGSLCELLKRYMATKREVAALKDIPWTPPASWHDVNLTDYFEVGLHAVFGEKLFDIMGLSKTYDWVNVVDSAQENFKRVLQHVACSTKNILPLRQLSRERTQKKLASPDICLHLTKLAWSTYWLSLSDFSRSSIFSDDYREQCAIQIGVSMYHQVFGPNFFASLFKHLSILKTQLDDDALKMLENYKWMGKKCGLSKSKWNVIIQSHQVLEKMLPLFRIKTEDIICFTERSEFCVFPDLDKDVAVMLTAWHLPLAKDYLDNVFRWMSFFEELVAPLTVFPILRELHQPLEQLLAVFRQAKFYAQVCMVYVDELDHIYGTGDFNWLSAVEYHETVHNLLSKLWLGDWLIEAFSNFLEILHVAWTKQELKEGLTKNPNRHRTFATFLNLEAYPSIETLFCDNPRHFAYWVELIPDFDKEHNNFKEVQAIWKDFRNKMEKGKRPPWNNIVKDSNSMNKDLKSEENIMLDRMNWNPKNLNEQVDFVKEAILMIKDSGSITDDLFSKMNEWLRMLLELSNSDQPIPDLDKMLDNLKFLYWHASLYILNASAIIATKKIGTTKRAVFVSQLLQQCTKQIAVSLSKFVCLAQMIAAEKKKFVPCPPKNWIDKVYSCVGGFLKTSPTGNLKSVNTNLEILNRQFWDKTLLDRDDEYYTAMNKSNFIGNNVIANSDNDSTKKINSTKNVETTKTINPMTNPQHNVGTNNNMNSQETDDKKCRVKCCSENGDLKSESSQGIVKSSNKTSSQNINSAKTRDCKEDDDTKNIASEVDSDEDVAPKVWNRNTPVLQFDTDDWYEDYHDILFSKWQELFKKVVSNCYRIAAAYRQQGGTIAHKRFPHWHTLLFFMREEICYSGVYVDYSASATSNGDANRFFKKNLMVYRLSWMDKEIEKWIADSSLENVNQNLFSIPTDSAGILQHHAVARVRILFSDIIIRSCVATTLGTTTNTFNVIRKATVDLLNEWSFFMLNLVVTDPTFWSDLSVVMINFTLFLEMFADYTETYRDHILAMDGNLFYKKWDLNSHWVPESVEHYRIVLLAMLRFNLVNFYLFITMELILLVNIHINSFMQVFKNIATLFFCLSSDKIMLDTMPGGMSEVKYKMLSIWQETKTLLPPTKKHAQLLSHFPESVVGNKSWQALILSYIGGQFDDVASKLALFSTSGTNLHHPVAKLLNKNKNKLQVDSRSNMQSEAGECVQYNSPCVSSTVPSKNMRAPKVTSVQNGKSASNPESNHKHFVSGKDANTLHEADSGLSENKSLVKIKALHSCAYCKSVEPSPKVYMKCALCKQHNFRPPMFYCGQVCHAKHWNDGHGKKHADFTAAN